MGASEFYIDYETEVENFTDEMKAEVENRLYSLAGSHTDMVGAAVSVRSIAKAETPGPFRYRARVVVYSRPMDINGTKEDDTVQGALKGALSAVERQVREKREKLGKPWEREDLNAPRVNDVEAAEAVEQALEFEEVEEINDDNIR